MQNIDFLNWINKWILNVLIPDLQIRARRDFSRQSCWLRWWAACWRREAWYSHTDPSKIRNIVQNQIQIEYLICSIFYSDKLYIISVVFVLVPAASECNHTVRRGRKCRGLRLAGERAQWWPASRLCYAPRAGGQGFPACRSPATSSTCSLCGRRRALWSWMHTAAPRRQRGWPIICY